jgi:hypothetical protein
MRPCNRLVPAVFVALIAGVAAGSAGALAHVHSSSGRTWYVSTLGSDSNGCTQAAPCLSFARAYQAASVGDTVLVSAGSYATQIISGGGKSSPGLCSNYAGTGSSANCVVFQPAPGATVSTGELRVLDGASHIEFRNFTSGGEYIKTSTGAALTNDIVYRNITDTQGFFDDSGSHVDQIGGSVGPGVDYHPDVQTIAGQPAPSYLLIDGVRYHDWTRSASGIHVECLQLSSGNHIIIRNSIFVNCDTITLNFDAGVSQGTGFESYVTLENNWLDAARDHASGSSGWGAYDLGINCPDPSTPSPSAANWLIRNNSFSDQSVQGIRIGPKCTFNNVKIVGNAGRFNPGNCVSGPIFSDNVWVGARCSGDRPATGSIGYLDDTGGGGRFDLHLAVGSPAIDAADPTNHPATDIDRRPRPLRWRPDAGASQLDSARLSLGRSLGAVTLGMQEPLVEQWYGQPRSRTKRGDTSTLVYVIHGGRLTISVAGDRVTGVETTTPYYTTASSFGVGSTLQQKPATLKIHWDRCARAFRGSASGSIIYLYLHGGRTGTLVRALTMTRRPTAGSAGCKAGA